MRWLAINHFFGEIQKMACLRYGLGDSIGLDEKVLMLLDIDDLMGDCDMKLTATVLQLIASVLSSIALVIELLEQ